MNLELSSDNICRINNKKCPNNMCCSLNNQCGEGINFCNTKDIYNGDNVIDKHNNLLNNELKYIYDNDNNILLSNNGRCGIDLKNKTQIKCKNNLYCNNFSFCEESNDNLLQLNINNTPISTQKYDGADTSRNVIIEKKNYEVSIDGKCGIMNNNKICPQSECCSKEGYCGNSKDHCYISQAENYENDINLSNIGVINKKFFSNNGSLEEYDKKTNEKLKNMYDTDNIVVNKGICGFNKDDEKVYKCPPEQCCSKNNICITNLDHCDLDNEKLIKLNGVQAIEKYINKKKEANNIKKSSELKNYFNNNNFCGKDLNNQIFNCNANDCCYDNKCGSGYDFCEFSDPNNIHHGKNALDNYNKNRISTDGTCNNKICPDGECCSNMSKCGKEDSYCNNMKSKFNGLKSLQYKFDKNNFVTDLSLNICGIKDNQIYKCNPGYCCLESGECSLDCSNSFVNKYSNDISENITFFINNNSQILNLKINELKNMNSKFLNITLKKSKKYPKNYAIRHSDKKKYYDNEIFILINELLNKVYTQNKLNGDNAINNYINKKLANTYNNGIVKTSNTDNCYIDYNNNVLYRCPPNTYCNNNNNVCNLCEDKTNKFKKLDGEKYDLYYFVLFLILLSFLVFYYINKNKTNV
jgi:hypothetical protein